MKIVTVKDLRAAGAHLGICYFDEAGTRVDHSHPSLHQRLFFL